MTTDMEEKSRLSFPARLRPRLPGGAIHRVELDDVETRFATVQGLYGNKESRVVLVIPHWRLVAAQYEPPRIVSEEGRCLIRYLDEKTEEHSLSFTVADPRAADGSDAARRRQNEYTEALARALEHFRQGGAQLPDLPSLELKVPGRLSRIVPWIALALGLALAIGALYIKPPILSLGASFVGLASLAALGFDRVRLHTPWHPVVKAVVYALAFIVALALFVASIALGDVLNIR
ncbi:MAG: hypothetical protein E3J64_08345 [Anaerolineales bacterium]|nr:MAG: hypothetical protein E3J64_08345 [Anaerolineales bacterium]